MECQMPVIKFFQRKCSRNKQLLLIFLITFQLLIPTGVFSLSQFQEDQQFLQYQKQYTWYVWKRGKKIKRQLDKKTYMIIKNECQKQNYPLHYALAVAFSESRFAYNAKSYAGALGLFQIMGKLHRLNCKKLIHDPEYNAKHGIQILKWYGKLAKGNLRRTLKNYNAGPGSNFYNEPYIKEITNNIHKSQTMNETVIATLFIGISQT